MLHAAPCRHFLATYALRCTVYKYSWIKAMFLGTPYAMRRSTHCYYIGLSQRVVIGVIYSLPTADLKARWLITAQACCDIEQLCLRHVLARKDAGGFIQTLQEDQEEGACVTLRWNWRCVLGMWIGLKQLRFISRFVLSNEQWWTFTLCLQKPIQC